MLNSSTYTTANIVEGDTLQELNISQADFYKHIHGEISVQCHNYPLSESCTMAFSVPVMTNTHLAFHSTIDITEVSTESVSQS